MNGLLMALLILVAVSALGVVFAPQTIYSALSLVVTVGLLAVIFLVLNAQFLFAVQLIVYAGAVMVLFVFIIALLDPASEERARLTDPRLILGVLAIAGICAAVFIAARNGVTYDTACTHQAASCMHGYRVGSGGGAADPYHTFGFPAAQVNAAGNVQTVANQLFHTYVLPFEITSLLLLVAAIGAVYLTRRTSTATGRGGAARPARPARPAPDDLPRESAEAPGGTGERPLVTGGR